MSDFLQVVGFDPLVITAPAGAPGVSGANGTNGVSVVSAAINGSNHLILTMSDASTIDAGALPSGGGGGAVASVNTKTGVVVLTADDIGDGTTNKAYPAADKTKLAGIATGATANSTDAQLRDRTTHTGTQSADTITDGTTNKAYTATEKTKLAGISGANTGDETTATIKTKLGVTTLSGSNTGDQTITLTGDVTGSGTGSFATALKSTGTAGTYGDATHVPQFTTDGQGRITGVTPVLISGGGGGVPLTTVTTKGDLIVATAASTVVRKGAGTDGYVLRARSSQSDGLGWSPEFQGPIRPFISNEWRLNFPQANGSAAPNTGTLFLCLHDLPVDATLDGLAALSNTAIAAGTMRIVVYSHNDATGLPNVGIADTGALSLTTSGTKSASGLGVSLPRGKFWAGVLLESVSGSPQIEISNPSFYGLWSMNPAGTTTSPSMNTGTDGWLAAEPSVSGSQVGRSFGGTLAGNHISPNSFIPCIWFRLTGVTP